MLTRVTRVSWIRCALNLTLKDEEELETLRQDRSSRWRTQDTWPRGALIETEARGDQLGCRNRTRSRTEGPRLWDFWSRTLGLQEGQKRVTVVLGQKRDGIKSKLREMHPAALCSLNQSALLPHLCDSSQRKFSASKGSFDRWVPPGWSRMISLF